MTSICFYIVCSWVLRVLLEHTEGLIRLALAFLAHPRGGQAVADALAGKVGFSVARVAAT